MSETSQDNPWNVSFAVQPTAEFKSNGQLLDNIAERLAAEGEPDNWLLYDRLDDTRFLDQLGAYSETHDQDIADYFRNSSRFMDLSYKYRLNGIFDQSRPVEIPQSPTNVYQNGASRRSEEGYEMDLDFMRQMDINPDYVLYFRVTQPAQSGTMKPEYYWTSDFAEVRFGLRAELGAQAQSAIILVSTLSVIAENGGLMNDTNDDNGVAVRQIGLEPFDQNRALFTIDRL